VGLREHKSGRAIRDGLSILLRYDNVRVEAGLDKLMGRPVLMVWPEKHGVMWGKWAEDLEKVGWYYDDERECYYFFLNHGS
jgi:hypothetical protein